MKEMELNILTPEKRFYSGKISELKVKCESGYIGILPGHTPLVMALIPHVLMIKENGEKKLFFIANGLLSLSNNNVDIVCEACELPENIDVARAQESKKRAEERLKNKDKDKNIDIKRVEYSLMRSLARLQLGK